MTPTVLHIILTAGLPYRCNCCAWYSEDRRFIGPLWTRFHTKFCPKYLATSLTWPRLFLACFESTGMDGQIGARTLVGNIGSYELTPFLQGQVAPDPLTHHISEAGSMHLPEPNGLVMT